MAWIYLVDTEGLPWPSKNGFIQLPIVKKSDTLNPSFFQEWAKAAYLMPPSGMMSAHYKEVCSQSNQELSTEDSPVKICLLQEMEKVWQGSEVDFFLRSCAYPKKSSPDSYSLKMFLASGQEDCLPLSGNWPISGMIVDGVLYPLKKLELTTKGNDGFCWPTPSATSYGSNQGGSSGRTGKKRHSLESMARTGNWPTPTVRDSAESPLPPRRKTTKDSGKCMGGQKPPLLNVIGGKLNPPWVEWLMGVPLGWTGLRLWAMEWFRCKSKKRSNI